MRYRARRQYKWSSNLAYAAGLIASDGCLQKDRRHLELTSIDVEQLEHFKLAIDRPELQISLKTNGMGRNAYRIQFSDTALYDFLLECGMTVAKSNSIATLNVPDEYFCHFLRGIFDGDGTVYGFQDWRWKASFMYYMSFASGSREFLKYLQQKNSELFLTGNGSITQGVRVANLSYAKKDSRLLYDAMYGRPDSLYLGRKREKVESFIFRI